MSENQETLEPTETDNVQNRTNNTEKYDINLIQGNLRGAESKSSLSVGQRVVAGDRLKVTVEPGEGLYFRNIGLNNAIYEVIEVDE